jgi:hypothetical protein
MQADVIKAMRQGAATCSADLGLREDYREFPHQIAFLCFAGDAIVALASLMAAFWLRFDTALARFGVEGTGIVLGSYANYILFGAASLLLVLAQKQMYEGSWLIHRLPALRDVFAACLTWGGWIFCFLAVVQVRAAALQGVCSVSHNDLDVRAVRVASTIS